MTSTGAAAAAAAAGVVTRSGLRPRTSGQGLVAAGKAYLHYHNLAARPRRAEMTSNVTTNKINKNTTKTLTHSFATSTSTLINQGQKQKLKTIIAKTNSLAAVSSSLSSSSLLGVLTATTTLSSSPSSFASGRTPFSCGFKLPGGSRLSYVDNKKKKSSGGSENDASILGFLAAASAAVAGIYYYRSQHNEEDDDNVEQQQTDEDDGQPSLERKHYAWKNKYTSRETSSPLFETIVPGVNLPAELHEKYNKYGKPQSEW